MHIWFNTHNYGMLGPIVFLERQKYTGKPTFGKVLIKKAWRARTQKILETGGVERIIFSMYYKKMAVLTYVPVHVSQNPRQNSTKIIRRFSFLLYRVVVQVWNYQYSTALKYCILYMNYVKIQYD